MRTKPLILTLETFFFLAVAASIPLQIMTMYEHDLLSMRVLVAQISVYNWLVIISSLANCFLAFHGHALLKVTIPVSFVLVLINNIQVTTHEVFSNVSVPWVASAGYLLMTIFFTLSEDHRRLMMNQSLRWWKSALRAKDQFEVLIAHPGQNPICLQSYDISKSGMYLDCSNPFQREWKSYQPGDKVLLYFRLPNGAAFNCSALVVRQMTNSHGNYPTGLGLKLNPLREEQKRQWLARVQEQLKKSTDNIHNLSIAA